MRRGTPAAQEEWLQDRWPDTRLRIADETASHTPQGCWPRFVVREHEEHHVGARGVQALTNHQAGLGIQMRRVKLVTRTAMSKSPEISWKTK